MNNIPDNIKEKLINKFIKNFQSSRIIVKVFSLFMMVILIFLISRLGYLGDGLKRVSENILSINIPYIDPPSPRLKISSSFEYMDSDKFTPIINEKEYKSNDVMSIKYTTNVKCWLFIVGVSKKGFQPFLNETLEPIQYTPYTDGSFDVIDFKLDNEQGIEYYYIFASESKFSFKKDIELNLPKFKVENSKGAALFNNINVPKNIMYKSVYFVHI